MPQRAWRTRPALPWSATTPHIPPSPLPNTNALPARRGRASMSASEVLDSGISCGRLFLVREAGNEMTLACWSISDHSRPPISSRRWAVSMSSLTMLP